MLNGIQKKFALMVAIALILTSFSFTILKSCGQTQQQSTLVQAEGALKLAYAAVQNAQNEGANVSSLVGQINSAAESLQIAETSFRSNDGQNVTELANECIVKVNGIVEAADSLGNEAQTAESSRATFNVLVETIGLAVLFVAAFFGWRLLTNLYVKRTLRLKPALVG